MRTLSKLHLLIKTAWCNLSEVIGMFTALSLCLWTISETVFWLPYGVCSLTHVQCWEAVCSPILARPGEVELFSSCSMTSALRIEAINKISCLLVVILDLIMPLDTTFLLISKKVLVIRLFCLFAAHTFFFVWFLTDGVKAPFSCSRCCLLKILVQHVSDYITAWRV